LLIMPKKHVKDFLDLDDNALLIKIKMVIQNMIRLRELTTKGYRLVVHGGGAQVIDHLHVHLVGPMGKAAKL